MVTLTPVTQKFILHWGEMGARWGINRTVAQVHALLYLSPKPINAEEIAETLSVARSNVSTSLKELQGWGIVKVVHVKGDRRDHFEAETDLWEMATRTEIRQFDGQQDRIKALAFAPDSKTLASGGEDTTILIWDIHSHP